MGVVRARSWRVYAALGAVAALGALVPFVAGFHRARAAFPGRNGAIAFEEGDTSADILTIRANGSHERNLTKNHGADDVDPSFSPNGKKIAFGSIQDSAFYQIWVMKAD